MSPRLECPSFLGRPAVFALLAAGLLAGCAGPAQLKPGTDRAGVLAQAGMPTAEYQVSSAVEMLNRLQYSWQPAGQAVYNVDLNAQGRVVRVEQALDEANFQRILVDQWTQADVLREFGQPYRVERVHAFKGPIWTWRYRQGPWDRLLHIYFDEQGVVRRWHPTDELKDDRLLDGPMR